jgi:hypothetical protein
MMVEIRSWNSKIRPKLMAANHFFCLKIVRLKAPVHLVAKSIDFKSGSPYGIAKSAGSGEPVFASKDVLLYEL